MPVTGWPWPVPLIGDVARWPVVASGFVTVSDVSVAPAVVPLTSVPAVVLAVGATSSVKPLKTFTDIHNNKRFKHAYSENSKPMMDIRQIFIKN